MNLHLLFTELRVSGKQYCFNPLQMLGRVCFCCTTEVFVRAVRIDKTEVHAVPHMILKISDRRLAIINLNVKCTDKLESFSSCSLLFLFTCMYI